MLDRIEPFAALDRLVLLDADGGASSLLRSADAWRSVNRSVRGRVIGFSRPQIAEDLHPRNGRCIPPGMNSCT